MFFSAKLFAKIEANWVELYTACKRTEKSISFTLRDQDQGSYGRVSPLPPFFSGCVEVFFLAARSVRSGGVA